MNKREFQQSMKWAEERGFNNGVRAAAAITQRRFLDHTTRMVLDLLKPKPSVKRSAKISKPSAPKMSATKKPLRGSAATETSTPTILKTSKRGKNATVKRQQS